MREEGVRVRGFAEDRGRLLALLSAIPVYPQEAPVAHISKATGFGGDEARAVLYRMSEAIPVAERNVRSSRYKGASLTLYCFPSESTKERALSMVGSGFCGVV